jgi:MEDS: MEthanogen/methylotroph, DcmR Sensory domain
VSGSRSELRAEPCEHLVQFYGGNERRLVSEVAGFLSETLSEGAGAMVIAAEPRRGAILAEVRGPIGRDAAFDELLVGLDAEEMLATFVRDGWPDAALFDANVGERIRRLAARPGRVRAYGEMVGLLWERQAYVCAIELERLWNRLMECVSFDLFCGYPIDVLGEGFQMPSVRPLLALHSRVVPILTPDFAVAIRRATYEVLGFATSPASAGSAESAILRLRSTFPRYADDILARATEYVTG